MRLARIGYVCCRRHSHLLSASHVVAHRSVACNGPDGDDAATRVDSAVRVQEDAVRKGFVSRETREGRELIASQYAGRESISDGTVTVLNLPAQTHTPTQFDKYSRSTTDFTSYITPFGAPTGTGLGAGFSTAPDKRLGFLRPRKTMQSFAGLGSPLQANFDEKGKPLQGEVMKRADIMKRRAEYMRTFEGTAISMQEHSLLADLDFDKDAVLFGNTREEFERNVTKLKKVIIAYTRWERTDNMYYYGTWILRLLTLWTLMDCLNNYYNLQLFAANYDLFVESMVGEVAELEARRARDMAAAAAELQSHPPDFEPVLSAIRAERELVVGSRARRPALAHDEQLGNDGREKETTHTHTSSHVAAVKKGGGVAHEEDIRALLISGKEAAVHKDDDEVRLPEERVTAAHANGERVVVPTRHEDSTVMHLAHSSGLLGDGGGRKTDDAAAGGGSGGGDSGSKSREGTILLPVPDRTSSSAFHPLDTTHEEYFREKTHWQEEQTEMRAIGTRVAQTTGQYGMARSLWRWMRKFVDRDAASLNLDDLVTYSYAASPTSIASARAVRRILLPRSEDYTQVVREEMAEYRASKLKQHSV